MKKENLQQAADELSKIIPDAIYSDNKVIIFTYDNKLKPSALKVLAKYNLSLSPKGMIVYTHKEKTKLGSNEKMENTFIAK